MTMKAVWNMVEGWKPAMLMVVSQIAATCLNVLYKMVIENGMSLRVMMAYRFMFATLFIAPLALILERLIVSQLYMFLSDHFLKTE